MEKPLNRYNDKTIVVPLFLAPLAAAMAASGLLLNPSSCEDIKASASRRNLEPFRSATIMVLISMAGPESVIMPLRVSRTITIGSIKLHIQARRGFRVDQQRLVLGGKELSEDHFLLQDYGVRHGDVLNLVLTLNAVDGNHPFCPIKPYSIIPRFNFCFLGNEGASSSDQQLLTTRDGRADASVLIKDLCLDGSNEDTLLYDKSKRPSNACGHDGDPHPENHIFDGFVDPRVCEVSSRVYSSSKENAAHSRVYEVIPKVCNCAALGQDSDAHSRVYQLTSRVCKAAFQLGQDTDAQSRVYEAMSRVCKDTTSLDQDWESLKSSLLVSRKDHQLQEVKHAQHPYHQCGYIQIAKYPIRIEVPGHFRDLVEHVRMGLNAGHPPKLASEGSGGVYFMKEECGLHNVAVFKPMDEEPMCVNNPRGFSSAHVGEGLKRGTKSGEGAIREVAAYILDHPAGGHRWGSIKKDGKGFAGVPPTVMVRCYHEAFKYSSGDHKVYKKAKLGSLQQFVAAVGNCEDMGSVFFSVEQVHKITVLDLRLANTDRHGGNILVCRGKDGVLKLVPIDHGYCLPEKFGECTFEWLYWPQAGQPYEASTLEYIESLDAEQDITLLQQCGWSLRPQCARVLRLATMVLKKGAAAGLTPFQIGSIMSCSDSQDVKPPIELMLEQAEAMRCPSTPELDFFKFFAGLLDEHIATVKPPLKECRV